MKLGVNQTKYWFILYIVYIGKLYGIIYKYSNTYHSAIKIKPFDLKSSTYIDSNKENSKERPKFKVHDYVRISKYKTIFAKCYVPNWPKEVFMIKNVKNTVIDLCY